jgi:hypothetical protein
LASFTSPRLPGEVAPKARVRGSFRKRGGNDLDHARHIFQDLIIPKPKNPVVVIGKPFVAKLVPRTIRVLSAIGFNDEPALATNEIDSVRADRLLPNELESVQSARAKLIPEYALGVCGCAAQASRTNGPGLVSTSHAVTPPHPDRIRCDPTSPRKRGEVKRSPRWRLHAVETVERGEGRVRLLIPDEELTQAFVVPANAGTHTPQRLC